MPPSNINAMAKSMPEDGFASDIEHGTAPSVQQPLLAVTACKLNGDIGGPHPRSKICWP